MWGTKSVTGKHMDKTLDLMMLNHPPSGTVILDVSRNRHMNEPGAIQWPRAQLRSQGHSGR